MRVFGSILIAGLILIGCSHSPVVAPDNTVTYLKKSDRDPASEPQLLWKPAALKVEVTSTSAKFSGGVTVNQEMIWKEMEEFQDTRNEYREYDVAGQCSNFICSANGGAKSALWDAYFSAPREKKAAALATAIQGVGPVSSEDLVARKYFTSKPKTWSEFDAEITRAANAGVIKKSVATSVLNNYKYENITNLGYTRESCREEVRTCTTTISKLVSVPFTNKREVERRRVVNSKTFTVDVSVNDAVLMSSEKDTLILKINEAGSLVDIDSNGFNRYAVSRQSSDGQRINLQLRSESRILRDLSSNVVRQDAYQLIGDQATFILDVDSAMIPGSDDPNAQLVVDYTIRVCKYGWTGLCGFGWDKLGMKSVQITGSRTVIPLKIPAQNKSDVLYTVSRKNSRFFNDKAISERSTESVKMPK